jgi:hypothetical protein
MTGQESWGASNTAGGPMRGGNKFAQRYGGPYGRECIFRWLLQCLFHDCFSSFAETGGASAAPTQ